MAACRVSNIRIRQAAQNMNRPMSAAVRVQGGASSFIEESDVASDTGHGIVVKGARSIAYMLHNHVHHSKGCGILFCDGATGIVEDNDICHNKTAGVAILSCADPLVRNNKIHHGDDSGVLISGRGKGHIEANDIFSNQRAGVAIMKEGCPVVKGNIIHHGCDSGILVCQQGGGSVQNNEIFGNRMAGIAIGQGSNSEVIGNRIADGSKGSLLCLSEEVKGLITANLIVHAADSRLQVPTGMVEEVHAQNFVQQAS